MSRRIPHFGCLTILLIYTGRRKCPVYQLLLSDKQSGNGRKASLYPGEQPKPAHCRPTARYPRSFRYRRGILPSICFQAFFPRMPVDLSDFPHQCHIPFFVLSAEPFPASSGVPAYNRSPPSYPAALLLTTRVANAPHWF